MIPKKADEFRKQVSSWSDLAGLVEHFSRYNGHDWLFRGVTDATHGLVPKIGRVEARKRKRQRNPLKVVPVPYRADDEKAVLAMFKQQARAYLASAPSLPLEWLAIAQHYGLPTRVLDWTDSLLVATWFAVESTRATKRDCAVWVTRSVPSVSLDYSGDPFELNEPIVYRPPHISPRISAQGSVLMICPEPTKELELPLTQKIVIDRGVRFTLQKRLHACGISRRHLFPDLGGLAEHLTWIYKHDWLAGYRPGSGPQPTAIAREDQENTLV